MWQQARTSQRQVVATLLAIWLLFSLLFASSAAQRDPDKEKKQRMEHAEPPSNPAKPPPKKRPPSAKPTKVNDPPEKPTEPPPVADNAKESANAPPDKAPDKTADPAPPALGSITIDFAALNTSVAEDAELHIFVNDSEWQKKQVLSDTQLLLENIPVGHVLLRIEHPMIQPFLRDCHVEVGDPESLNPEFDLARGKLTVVSEPQATVRVTGAQTSLQKVTNDTGEAVFYLQFKVAYTIKVMKDALSREDSPVYVENLPGRLPLPLSKRSNKIF